MANDLIGVTDRGNPGLDGLNFLSGSRNPTQQEGRENELWLNIRTQVVFQKVASRWVPRFRMKGEKGDRGDRGFSLRSGDSAPDAAVGRDGDIYVQMVSTTDVNAPALWGPKLNGSWSWREPVDLRGAQGDVGETGEIGLGWFFGTGAPSNGIGRDGEVYFRTSNSDVYGKAGGVWGVVASLVGPQGDTGNPGPAALLPVTPWVTGMAAVVGPPATYVSNAGSSYQCLVSHTAGASFAVDFAAGKWGLVAEKGADGAGTGTVVPDNPGALAGLLAVFAANNGTSIGGSGGTAGGAINWAAAVDVASAATCDIGAAASNVVNITGTTGITSFGTVAAGAMRWVKFAASLTLTHNGTSLILPGGANITTAAGDTAVFVSEGSGNWRCLGYQRANGGIIAQAAASDFWAGTSVSKPTTPKTIADAAARIGLTSGTTINTDCSVGRNFKVTLGHNATFAKPTNMRDGEVYTWQINQPSSGGPYTGAFNAAFEFPSTPTLSTAASKKDIVSAMYDADADVLIARFSKGS